MHISMEWTKQEHDLIRVKTPGKESPEMVSITEAGKKELEKYFKDRRDMILRIYMTFG